MWIAWGLLITLVLKHPPERVLRVAARTADIVGGNPSTASAIWGIPLALDHIGISSKATPYCTPSVSPTCWQLLLRNESGLKDGSPRLSM